jgi:hypothetical protein|eukprot:SAG25_NODE_346_length_9382_cov_25.918669_10_plen_93_part_00
MERRAAPRAGNTLSSRPALGLTMLADVDGCLSCTVSTAADLASSMARHAPTREAVSQARRQRCPHALSVARPVILIWPRSSAATGDVWPRDC